MTPVDHNDDEMIMTMMMMMTCGSYFLLLLLMISILVLVLRGCASFTWSQPVCHKNIGIGQISADVRNVPVMQLTLSVRLEVRTLARSQTGEESYHHTQSLDTTITI